jgi:23S rRNA (cytosine1962-C5)-methyltransferase
MLPGARRPVRFCHQCHFADESSLVTAIASPRSTAPKVYLKERRALPFFSRHPWVFAGAIQRIEGDPQPGTEVTLHAADGRYIATGLFNPKSQIRVRLYSWDEAENLDAECWSRRLDSAFQLRRTLGFRFDAETACRLVFSEGDGLSGLIVDRYGDWLLVQFTALGLALRREMLLDLLDAKLHPRGIWLRTEKGIRESENLEQADGLARGSEPHSPLLVAEHGVRYGIDVIQGHKTGFYLDQRDNRTAVARYVAGHRILDMFCYTGGFGLSALKTGGAREVVGVDVSEAALTLARANAELNGVSDKTRFVKSDAFEELQRLANAGEMFDTVILDPPKLTRHRAGLAKALRGYHSLNQLALRVLVPGGILVSCSCSGLVGRDDFVAMLASVSQRSGRPIQILESRSQSADHPVSVHCLESSYLKCYICRVA